MERSVRAVSTPATQTAQAPVPQAKVSRISERLTVGLHTRRPHSSDTSPTCKRVDSPIQARRASEWIPGHRRNPLACASGSYQASATQALAARGRSRPSPRWTRTGTSWSIWPNSRRRSMDTFASPTCERHHFSLLGRLLELFQASLYFLLHLWAPFARPTARS